MTNHPNDDDRALLDLVKKRPVTISYPPSNHPDASRRSVKEALKNYANTKNAPVHGVEILMYS